MLQIDILRIRIVCFLLAFGGIFCFSGLPAKAADRKFSTVRGTVESTTGDKIDFATVFLKNTSFASYSGADGKFVLKAPPGNYLLCVRMVGYKTFEKEVELVADDVFYLTIPLVPEIIAIDDVEVTGQSVVKQINNTAFNVTAIETKPLQNTTMDLSQVLDKVSGVKIKTSGGVGSSSDITLNGFSGQHVKVFIDGIPMQGSGDAMGLGKIPVNMAERIEVYKGVVPIELGSDALGGAINIVTKNTSRTFVDASYSYGSFNTHKTSILFGSTFNSGLSYQLNFYQNYSDNNYRIKTNLLNLETNTFSTEQYWFRRFHDTYHNEVAVARIGVRNKPWAKRLMLETTIGKEKADIQNANLVKFVFGGKYRTSKNINPALYYDVENLGLKGLNLSVSAKYNHTINANVDTMARQYNWAGDYKEKSTKGETTYALSKYYGNTGYVTGNLKYKLDKHQQLNFNHVYSSYNRKASDSAASDEETTEADFMKKTNTKNVSGLSYNYSGEKQKWNLMGFSKYYHVHVAGPVDSSTDTSHESYEESSTTYDAFGYGAGGALKLSEAWYLKTSYEKTYRLPTENELYGDESLERGNAGLKPEKSQNVNLNINFQLDVNKVHFVNIETGLVYRFTYDYIRREILEKYGEGRSVNWGKVQTVGADIDVNYSYRSKLFFSTAFTYQEIRNKEQYTSTGQKSIIYNDRVPNQPYLFGNTNLSYTWADFMKEGNSLNFAYQTDYVHDFFRSWESEGAKLIIPGHLTHDLMLNYSLKKGRYNVTLEARNVTDEMVFDNYNLQKPGRSFAVKLRYNFSK